jgi:hypothetical protein
MRTRNRNPTSTKQSSTIALLQCDPFPWTYTSEHLPPSSPAAWTKVAAPDNKVIPDCIRWNGYQVGEVVGIEIDYAVHFGVIVAMFNAGGKMLSVVAWVYEKKDAKRNGLHKWPRDATYLISNHFQLIDHDCFIDPALRNRRVLFGMNYEQGINLHTKRVERFKNCDNDVVAARAFQRPFPFLDLPLELQSMVFQHVDPSEYGLRAMVDRMLACYNDDKQVTLNSPSFWGVRNSCRDLRQLTDKWLLKNKPLLGRIAYSDNSLGLPKILEFWDDFTTSFRHIQITLYLDKNPWLIKLLCQLKWLLFCVVKILPLLDKEAGTHLTLFLLAEDSRALAKLTQSSDALGPLIPRLQELAALALGSQNPIRLTFKQHYSLADNRKDKLSAAYDEELARLKKEAQENRAVENQATAKGENGRQRKGSGLEAGSQEASPSKRKAKVVWMSNPPEEAIIINTPEPWRAPVARMY